MNKVIQQSKPVLKFIRMTTGEDLITEYTTVIDDNGEYYILNNPMKVVYIANKTIPNRISITLIQWIFQNICEEQSFILHPNDIITMGTPAKELASYYYQLINHVDAWEQVEPTDEELKSIEEENFKQVSDEELDQLKKLLSLGPDKKKLLH